MFTVTVKEHDGVKLENERAGTIVNMGKVSEKGGNAYVKMVKWMPNNPHTKRKRKTCSLGFIHQRSIHVGAYIHYATALYYIMA